MVNGQRGLEINCSRSVYIQQLLHAHFSLCLIKDIGSPCQKLHMLTFCALLFKLDEGSWLFFVKTFPLPESMNKKQVTGEVILTNYLVDDDLRTANVFSRLCLPQRCVVILETVLLNIHS